jgi:hypothetical protein
MTRKTMLALLAQADANLSDNTTHDISAADVRQLIKDVVDSFSPGYGIMSNASINLIAVGPTPPRVVSYTSTLAATPEYVCTQGAGTIKRLAQGLPTTVNRISFYADVSGQSGSEFTFALFRDGVQIPGGTTVTGQGAGNFANASFSIATTSPAGADHTYDVRVSKVSGAAGDVLLTDVRFIAEIIPTIGI